MTIQPFLGPPGSLTIDGKDATVPQTAASATPVLSWSAPTVGTADFYEVSAVYVASSGAGTATGWLPFSVYTAGTSLTLPAGLLTSGTEYTLVITAHSEPGRDEAHPLAHANTWSATPVMTATVTIP